MLEGRKILQDKKAARLPFSNHEDDSVKPRGDEKLVPAARLPSKKRITFRVGNFLSMFYKHNSKPA